MLTHYRYKFDIRNARNNKQTSINEARSESDKLYCQPTRTEAPKSGTGT